MLEQRLKSSALVAVMLSIAVVLFPAAALAREDLTVGGVAVVTGTEGSGIRLRSGPGMSYRVAGGLAEGTKVTVMAGPVSDGNDDWWQVSVGSTTGWGVERYLDPAGSSAVKLSDDGQRQFLGKVTAYANGIGGVPVNARTASGTKTRWGTLAVDPKVVPLGSAMTIEGYDDMVFTAEDTGGAIRGTAVDIWLPDPGKAKTYGTQYRRITVVREGPVK